MDLSESEEIKRQLAVARAEIQRLKMRLRNAEILYKYELQKAATFRTQANRAQRN